MASGPIPFIDGHNDVLLALHLAGAGAGSFLAGRSEGHLDLPRARVGGFAAGFFAVFVLPESEEERAATRLSDRKPPYAQPLAGAVPTAHAAREAGQIIDLLEALASGGDVRVARSAKEVEAALNGGPLAAILHLEGAEPIDPDLDNLGGFYDRGLRSLGLVWSRPNVFAKGVPFRFPSSPDIGGGLTEAGRRLVAECNRFGILIDLAHLNECGFWDVTGLSAAPLVASHSNAHALSPNSRNLTDPQIDEIGRSGGIVGITFHAGMLTEAGGVDASTPLARVIDHVDYVADRIGIDHVGFGSDFDGATVPNELGDATGLPRVVEALR
ncbi:MAG: dipeptidase, partial [Actinomycetota bacterium]|nr:dipeptidase [Actinomycetota bacterium]